jgi:hypothetical protein
MRPPTAGPRLRIPGLRVDLPVVVVFVTLVASTERLVCRVATRVEVAHRPTTDLLHSTGTACARLHRGCIPASHCADGIVGRVADAVLAEASGQPRVSRHPDHGLADVSERDIDARRMHRAD